MRLKGKAALVTTAGQGIGRTSVLAMAAEGTQFWMIQAVPTRMLATGGGSIINMSSVCSSLKGLPNRFIYGTSKAAVVGLTKSVSADFVGQGIRCNAIAPGTVDTPSLTERFNSYPDPVEARRNCVARQPMGSLAQAHEIAPSWFTWPATNRCLPAANCSRWTAA